MINKFSKISESIWNEIVPYLKKIELPAKTTLIKEGEISNKAFYIEMGCIRSWF